MSHSYPGEIPKSGSSQEADAIADIPDMDRPVYGINQDLFWSKGMPERDNIRVLSDYELLEALLHDLRGHPVRLRREDNAWIEEAILRVRDVRNNPRKHIKHDALKQPKRRSPRYIIELVYREPTEPAVIMREPVRIWHGLAFLLRAREQRRRDVLPLELDEYITAKDPNENDGDLVIDRDDPTRPELERAEPQISHDLEPEPGMPGILPGVKPDSPYAQRIRRAYLGENTAPEESTSSDRAGFGG